MSVAFCVAVLVPHPLPHPPCDAKCDAHVSLEWCLLYHYQLISTESHCSQCHEAICIVHQGNTWGINESTLTIYLIANKFCEKINSSSNKMQCTMVLCTRRCCNFGLWLDNLIYDCMLSAYAYNFGRPRTFNRNPQLTQPLLLSSPKYKVPESNPKGQLNHIPFKYEGVLR